jgi:hypothetical protein
VLRARTRGGDFFFKAVPVLFAGEPALTRELGRRHPGRAPTVVAADAERRWLLMRDFDGAALSEQDSDAVCDALRAYARHQVEWIGAVDHLYTLGCPDRTLDALEGEIDAVLGDTAALLPGRSEGLSPTQLSRLPELADRLRAACARLRGYELPPTLEHGDLHPGNIRRRDDGFLVFDWSDGCVSVPFFSLVPFLEVGARHLVEAFELAELLSTRRSATTASRGTRKHAPAGNGSACFRTS